MIRELNKQELQTIAGGIDVYPPSYPNLELVGWSQVIVGYDTYTTYEKGFFFDVVRETTVPIYDIQPIYTDRVVLVYY